MPKSLILSAIAVSALAFAVSANAETAKPAAKSTDAYIEVGGAAARVSGENFGTANFTIGKTINRSFAVELETQVGVTSKSYTYGGYTVKLKVDHALAGYAVGTLPVSANVDLIGRVGYMTAQVKASSGGAAATDSETGPAYGIGLRYFPNGGNAGVRADITHFDLSNGLNGDLYLSLIHI